VHIEFTEGEDKITLEGPTKDVQIVQGQIQEIVTDLVRLISLLHETHRLPIVFFFSGLNVF